MAILLSLFIVFFYPVATHYSVCNDAVKLPLTSTFNFNGEPLGKFIVPPFTVEGMAITDLSLIAHATPDKSQAYQILNAFMNGSLVLEAEFDATLQVPALFNYTGNFTVKNIPVDVTALADRTLCQCPSWYYRNQSSSFLMLN
jgi:hypothetical protein